MKSSLAVIGCAVLLLVLSAAAQSKSGQGNAQIVSTAEIVKIDAKKKSLQVKELVGPNPAPGRGTERRSGGAGGGGGRPGGGRRRGGIGFPGGGGGGGTPYPGGGGARTNQAKEYKVFITKDTVLKLAETNIDFSDLHVGDRITVSGTPKGSKGDLQATTVTREFQ